MQPPTFIWFNTSCSNRFMNWLSDKWFATTLINSLNLNALHHFFLYIIHWFLSYILPFGQVYKPVYLLRKLWTQPLTGLVIPQQTIFWRKWKFVGKMKDSEGKMRLQCYWEKRNGQQDRRAAVGNHNLVYKGQLQFLSRCVPSKGYL